MKLNGWHRLWILLSVVYLISIAIIVINEYPKVESISHQSEFYKKLSKKSAGIISPTTYEDAKALGGTDVPAFDIPDAFDKALGFYPIVEMPNKHSISFIPESSEEDMKIVSQEYLRIVEQEATKKQRSILLKSFLVWSLPCLGVYALGWGVSWVFKGFKKNKKA